MEEHKWRVSAIIWTGCGKITAELCTQTQTCSNCEGQFHLQFLPVHFNFVISNQSASPLLWHKGNYTSKLQHRFNTVACRAFLTQKAHLHTLQTESVISCQWWASQCPRFPRQEANRTYAHQLHAVLWKIQHIYFVSSRGISKLAGMPFS